MPSGMLPAPSSEMGGRTMATTDENGQPSSIHIVPLDQLVHEIDMEGSCVCGPDVSYVHTEDRVLPHCAHWALDPRYYEALHWDWGPDGPDGIPHLGDDDDDDGDGPTHIPINRR